MGAIVETWVSELEKLKQKVTPKKPLLFLAKAKGRRTVEEEEKEAEDQETKAVHKDSVMNEATVCLLMDRFAPL